MSKTNMIKYIDMSPSKEFIVLGFDNGEYQLRCLDQPDRYISFRNHDAQKGKITAVKFDEAERFAISTSEDGLMYVQQIDREGILKEALFDPTVDIENIDYIPSDELKQIIANKWSEFRGANPPYYHEVDRLTDGIEMA